MWCRGGGVVSLSHFLLRQKINQKKATGKQTLRSFPDALLPAMAVSVWCVSLANPPLAPPRRGMFVVVGGGVFFGTCGGQSLIAAPKAESARDGSCTP